MWPSEKRKRGKRAALAIVGGLRNIARREELRVSVGVLTLELHLGREAREAVRVRDVGRHSHEAGGGDGYGTSIGVARVAATIAGHVASTSTRERA